MTEDRLIAAFGRLEEAVARFETRLPARLRNDAFPEADAIALTDPRQAGLDARHEALRSRTAAALERLDRLLESVTPTPAPATEA